MKNWQIFKNDKEEKKPKFMSDEEIQEYNMKDDEPVETPKKRPNKFRTKEELEQYLRDDP